jgi:predicted acyltransferase (DUF342 family)
MSDSNEIIPFYSDFLDSFELGKELIESIDPIILAGLPKSEKLVAAGLIYSEGGIFENKVSLAGKFSSSNTIICNTLSSSGSVRIDGFLAVKEKARIAGKMIVHGHVIFAGDTALSGKIDAEGYLISSNNLRIAGKMNLEEGLIANGPVLISGTVTSKRILSSNTISVKGKLFLEEEIKAKEFILGKSGGQVGSIIAEKVTIGSEVIDNKKDIITGNLHSPINLFSYITKLIKRSLKRNSDIIEIYGDIVCKNVYIANAVVNGNIKADTIEIGPNVEIAGLISYKDKIILNEANREYNAKQLPSSE